MKEQWNITSEDAEAAMNFLQICIDEYESAGIKIHRIESIKNVHAALMWADRIEIDNA